MIFRNALAIDEIGQWLLEERWTIGPTAWPASRRTWPRASTAGLGQAA
ncbi:hypothetical protein ACWDE0_40035 [Streptomyces sp. 900105755]